MLQLPNRTALILIDLQKAIDDPSWGERNNPDAERNARRLLDAWRARRMPLYHVRHDSTEPNSTYRPGQPLHDFKPEVAPAAGEIVVAKRVHSAFIGTDLSRMLIEGGQTSIVVAGVITNNSVEATVRNAQNLGFRTFLVEDACFTFGRKDWDGNWHSAREVHAMALANLDGEYCTVLKTEDVLGALRGCSGEAAAPSI